MKTLVSGKKVLLVYYQHPLAVIFIIFLSDLHRSNLIDSLTWIRRSRNWQCLKKNSLWKKKYIYSSHLLTFQNYFRSEKNEEMDKTPIS